MFDPICGRDPIRTKASGPAPPADLIRSSRRLVLGLRLDPFDTVVEKRMLNKLLSIMDNEKHPLHHTLDRQREHLF